MRASRSVLALSVIAAISAGAGPAGARESCSRVVVFTLPGITWEHVAETRPPSLMRIIAEGATGSMSVRTNSARTSYASGFATLGAGTRVEGGATTGGTLDPEVEQRGFAPDVTIAGLPELRRRAGQDGYRAMPGALGEALATIPAVAIGNADPAPGRGPPHRPQRWPLLAAMDGEGRVDLAAVGPDLLEREGTSVRTDTERIEEVAAGALERDCAVTFIDHGDLVRAELRGGPDIDRDRTEALEAADALLGEVEARLDAHDLLLVVSPTSPADEPEAHLGIGIVRGPGFAAGASLSSPSTRREGIVTLPDVAPTILEHLSLPRHSAMLGRAMTSGGHDADPIARGVSADREAIFVDAMRIPVWTGYVVLQLAVYALIAYRLSRRRPSGAGGEGRGLEVAALGLLAVPIATFLVGAIEGHELGVVGYLVALTGVTAALVAAVLWALSSPLDRVLALAAVTTIVLIGDLLTGSVLQINTVFGYSPIVAGRFAGIGNIGFSVLGGAVVLAGALLIRRVPTRNVALLASAGLFVVTVVVTGGPRWGSDVGGTMAFVPALGITWLLLKGKRIGWPTIAVCTAAALGAVALFLAWDLRLPEGSRTHLARLFEDVRDRGPAILTEVVGRKIRANLRVFTSTVWAYLVPPLLIFVGWLLARPRGRWGRVGDRYPEMRAAIVGGLVLALLGFAINDSGIVVPAVILSMLVPAVLIVHLLLEREPAA